MGIYRVKKFANSESKFESNDLSETLQNCPPGYTVYNASGEGLYTNPQEKIIEPNYKGMWNQLKTDITNKAKSPTFNARTELKQAEEIARKQTYLDIMTIMDDMEKAYSTHSTSNEKYAI